MKKYLLLLVAILINCSLYAQVPNTISWQGIIQDANGNNLNVNYTLTLKLFDAVSGGTALWTETHNSVAISNGIANLVLGSVTSFGLNFDKQYWLEITVGSGTPMPRILLTSVPYSLHSKTAESISGPITETDPIFDASASSGIINSDILKWNIAYSWGNHATEGYLTEYSESDPTWSGSNDTTGNIYRYGNLGLGTEIPLGLLHTYGIGTGEGNVLFVGERKLSNPGAPPTSGTGTRLMWYPDKAAFRAGHVSNLNWDKDNIGNYSVAMGLDTKASGGVSTAIGNGAIASGGNAIALGFLPNALGDHSVAIGSYATTGGSYAIAIGVASSATGMSSMCFGVGVTSSGEKSSSFGNNTSSRGSFATAMGDHTIARSGFEMAFGRFNTDYIPNDAYGWNDGDRLFVIGNGTSADDQNNALTILKNGNIGIGVDNPTAQLHTNGTLRFSGAGTPALGKVLTSDDDGNGTWQDQSEGSKWTTSGYNIHNKNIGFVGIGTSSPINNLHISSGSVFTGLKITNTASGETSSDGFLIGMQYQESTTNKYGLMKLHEDIPLYIKAGSAGSSFDQLIIHPNGNIGIGTSEPSELLHVNNWNGAARIRLSASSTTLPELDFFSGNTYKGAIGYQNASNYLFIYENGNIIFKNGRIGIQSIINPSYGVELPNNSSNGIGRALAYSWNTYSDSRLKSDRSSITYGLNELMKLEPIKYFHHNSITENGSIKILSEGTYDIGFIAQDLFKIIPEIVSKPENENIGLWSLSYEKLTPILVKAIQEQQQIINKQQSEIDDLKMKYENLIELLQNQSNK